MKKTQAAFERLVHALEEFHATAIAASDPESPAVLAAADDLADAYTLYDDALFTEYGVDAPLDTYEFEVEDEN